MVRPSMREPSIRAEKEEKTCLSPIYKNYVDEVMRYDTLNFLFMNLPMANSASRSLKKRTTPTSLPRISANLTSPTSRNLSRNVCQVQLKGI